MGVVGYGLVWEMALKVIVGHVEYIHLAPNFLEQCSGFVQEK